jgi:AraC-like DNA-binding protein
LFGDKLLFHTRDLDEARDKVSQVYTRHRLDYRRSGHDLDTYFYHIPLPDSSVNYLGYGSDMVVNPGELEEFFLIQTPITGSGDVCCGKQHIITSHRQSSVLSPTEDIKLIWGADCWKVQVRLDRRLMERCLSAMLEEPLSEPIVFKLGMDMTSEVGQSWRGTVGYVAETALRLRKMGQSNSMDRQLEQLLMQTLLQLQPHNYSERLQNHRPGIAPRHVKRAEEYIRNHCKTDVNIDDLAAASGVSARTLYKGFQEFRGVSPMKFLKLTRLESVHRELLDAEPSDSVTRIAMDYGFRQLGRFAVEYRQRFGESPSDTLRQAPGCHVAGHVQ